MTPGRHRHPGFALPSGGFGRDLPNLAQGFDPALNGLGPVDGCGVKHCVGHALGEQLLSCAAWTVERGGRIGHQGHRTGVAVQRVHPGVACDRGGRGQCVRAPGVVAVRLEDRVEGTHVHHPHRRGRGVWGRRRRPWTRHRSVLHRLCRGADRGELHQPSAGSEGWGGEVRTVGAEHQDDTGGRWTGPRDVSGHCRCISRGFRWA